jgi:DNA mismatch repair ATPase MutL
MNTVLIMVEDNGIGISPEDAAPAFLNKIHH